MTDTKNQSTEPETAGSPVSDTLETDAALVDHMPKDATEWSEHYLALSIHARKLERERNAALGKASNCKSASMNSERR